MVSVSSPGKSQFDYCHDCGGVLTDEVCPYCLLRLGKESESLEDYLKSDLPRQFGDYELVEMIARGGMGVVYRARQQILDRTVAVKLILAGQLATPESIQRFQTEARAAARLDHPHIVPVYDVGMHQGQHFLSMKLIEGTNLGEAGERFQVSGKLTGKRSQQAQRRAVALLQKIASAITCSHQHGVMHRDLKPANILIDADGQPHVTDFGLAKLTGATSDGLTLTTATLGSPSYMSPEQAGGDASAVGFAADTYGLGAILYELLTGQPPFVGGSVLDTMRAVIERPVLPPRRINFWIDRDLETIVLRCLEKRPQDRYDSVSMLSDDLQRFSDGRPILARPVGTLETLQRWCRRKPLIAGLLAALWALFVVGFAAVAWQWQRAETVNHKLQATVEDLRWRGIIDLVDRGEHGNALAYLAGRLRQRPDDWRAATMATSILRYHNFAIPIAPALSHGEEFFLHDACFSPSGNTIATAGTDYQARLWDVVTGKSAAPPMKHQGVVYDVAFSPAGQWLATASADGTARCWSTMDAAEEFRVQHDGPVRSVDFSKSGRWLASCSDDATVHLIEMATGQEIREPLLLSAAACSVCFHHDDLLLVGSRDGLVRILELADSTDDWLRERGRIDTGGELKHVSFGPDGNLAIAQSADGSIGVWDWSRGESLYAGRAHADFTPSISPDGRFLLTRGRRHSVRLFPLRQPTLQGPELSHRYQVFGTTFHPSGQYMASTGWDYTARVFDHDFHQVVEPIPLRAPGHTIAFSPNGDRLLVREGSVPRGPASPIEHGAVSLWDFRLAQSLPSRPNTPTNMLASAPGRGWLAVAESNGDVWLFDQAMQPLQDRPLQHESGFRSLTFTPAGDALVTATVDGVIRLWHVGRSKLIGAPMREGSPIMTGTISDDGLLFAVGTRDGHVSIWDLKRGERHTERMVHGGEMNAVSFSPDGRWLASASDDDTAVIWRVDDGRLVHRLKHRYRVQGVNFSPSSDRLVTASNDFTARIWDVASGTPVGSPLRHQGEVGYATFSPDGTRVLTCSRDATARVWDSASGQAVLPAMTHQSALREAMFTPDGRRIVTIDHEAVRMWDASSGQPVTVSIAHRSGSGIGYDSDGVRSVYLDNDRLLTGVATDSVRLIDLTWTPDPVSAGFVNRLEAIAGRHLDSTTGVVQRLGIAERLGILRENRRPLLDGRDADNRSRKQSPAFNLSLLEENWPFMDPKAL